MITVQDVYIKYQQARARFTSRPYRIPKKWDAVWAKMSEPQVYNVEMITKAFNTRWQNVDIDKYFDIGFQLFGKGFTYTKFYDRRILLSYIEKDKQSKRQKTNILESYNKSNEYVIEWLNKRPHRDDLSIYKQYCMMNDNGIKAPIKHYLSNHIDKYMLTWLINRKYLSLEEHEKSLVPIITENYWTLSEEINEIVGVDK